MSGFIEGENRDQSTLFPERFDDCVGEDSLVHKKASYISERYARACASAGRVPSDKLDRATSAS